MSDGTTRDVETAGSVYRFAGDQLLSAMFVGVPASFRWAYLGDHNPLEAMCHYRDSHSVERLPEPPKSTAKPAMAGLCVVRELGERSGIGA